MTQKELNEVLHLHKQWWESDSEQGKRSNLRGENLIKVDMQDANLQHSDMRDADMQGANMRGADMLGADMQGANMRGADMVGADMRCANLTKVDMRGADMRGANLTKVDMRGADMRGADVDFSAWPLWCGSFGVKCDIRLASQLAYHFCRLDCKDREVKAAQNALIKLANKFHRVEECGVLKPKLVSKKRKLKTKLKTNKVRRKGKVNKV